MGEVVELVRDVEAAQPPPGWTIEQHEPCQGDS